MKSNETLKEEIKKLKAKLKEKKRRKFSNTAETWQIKIPRRLTAGI